MGINLLLFGSRIKSVFTLPRASLQEKFVVKQNCNMTWNENVMLTKVQHQEILPQSPIILPTLVPVAGIPKRGVSVHQISMLSKNCSSNTHPPDCPKPFQSYEFNAKQVCGCKLMIRKTIIK